MVSGPIFRSQISFPVCKLFFLVRCAKLHFRNSFREPRYVAGPAVELLVQPARSTVGERLLMRQGWKPGQGIGPKVTKHTRTDRFRSYEQTYGATSKPAPSAVGTGTAWWHSVFRDMYGQFASWLESAIESCRFENTFFLGGTFY